MTHRIVTLPGDGIGPEIMAPARARARPRSATFELEEHVFGGASIDAHGIALTDEVLDACRAADAVLLAAVGGPKWDTTDPAKPRARAGPARRCARGSGCSRTCARSPLPGAVRRRARCARERIDGTDLLVVRELTGGIYFGAKTRTRDLAPATSASTRPRRSSGSRASPSAPRGRKVTSVDKANVLETSRLWREVVVRVHAEEFPDVELEHVLVDNAAMQLVAAPRHFDVIVTENMFGDILSDEAAMITGSIGMLPSASLGGDGPGLFEPVHGSAPDIAGHGRSPTRSRCSSRSRCCCATASAWRRRRRR